MKYKVIREHFGDKAYVVGDTRDADPGDVAHLLGTCLLSKEDFAAMKAAKAAASKGAKVAETKADVSPDDSGDDAGGAGPVDGAGTVA